MKWAQESAFFKKNFEPFQLAVVLTETNWQGICMRHEKTTRPGVHPAVLAGRMQQPPPSNLHTISTRSGVKLFRSTINGGGGESSRSRRPVLTFLPFTHPPLFSDWREKNGRERGGQREGGREETAAAEPPSPLAFVVVWSGADNSPRKGENLTCWVLASFAELGVDGWDDQDAVPFGSGLPPGIPSIAGIAVVEPKTHIFRSLLERFQAPALSSRTERGGGGGLDLEAGMVVQCRALTL